MSERQSLPMSTPAKTGTLELSTCHVQVSEIGSLLRRESEADAQRDVHQLTGFPGGSAVKDTSAMQEMWIQSLGQEGPLEKKMATNSSIFA